MDLEDIVSKTSLITLFLILIFTYLFYSKRGLPPGPFTWPVFGNLSILNRKQFYKYLSDQEKKYGNLFRFSLGSRHITVVAGHEHVRNVLLQDIKKVRPTPLVMAKLCPSSGIIWSNGSEWNQMNQLSVLTSKHFMSEVSNIDAVIQEEVRLLINDLYLEKCRPVQIEDFISNAVYNIISTVAIGERLEFERPSCRKFKESLQDLSKWGMFDDSNNDFGYFSSTNRISKMQESKKYVNEFLEPRLLNHKAAFVKKNSGDFIDICLRSNREKDNTIMDEQIIQAVTDLYVAGCAPLVSILLWSVLLMIRCPELQKKCRNKMHQIGIDKHVTWRDRGELQFLSATLFEVQRFSSAVPLGYPYQVVEDTYIGEYRIPKGDLLLFNLMSVHKDHTYWKRPNEFRPENFLESDGKLIVHESFIPYGLGDRCCKFDLLSDKILFLVLTNLLLKFDIRAPEDNPLPSVVAEEGHVRYPKPFVVVPYPLD